jgi:hypothetical protein
MVKEKVHEWVVKMWDERKLSFEFSDKDEYELVSLVEQLAAQQSFAVDGAKNPACKCNAYQLENYGCKCGAA